jgi:hypothetical protein
MIGYDELRALDLPSLLEALSKGTTGSTEGKDRLQIIPPFVLVRTAEMVDKQLASTSTTVHDSANQIKETLDHSTSIVKLCLENSSEWLINAIKVNTEITSANAKQIEERISQLTTALTGASENFRAASDQSSRLGRRLNWLTGALVFAAVLTASATVFQALESKRQADFNDRTERTQPTPNRPAVTPTNRVAPAK